jgi:hypothetical protein
MRCAGVVDVVEAADAATLSREDGTLDATIKHAQVQQRPACLARTHCKALGTGGNAVALQPFRPIAAVAAHPCGSTGRLWLVSREWYLTK